MIRIPGELSIRTLTGRYGQFNTAKLVTDIGEFVVKDKMLDEYTEGKYQGEFLVRLIKPHTYTYGSRFVIENRAYLEGMSLQSNDELSSDDLKGFSPQEPDPIMEEIQSAQELPLPQDGSIKQDAVCHDSILFGLVWPLGDSVKLDATVDRAKLRQQRDRLCELNYELDYKTQTWNKKVDYF